MDGVLVREEHALPGAAEFLQTLTERERPFLVLTNNSIFTPRDLAARLLRSGLAVPEEVLERDVRAPIIENADLQTALVAASTDDGLTDLIETLTDLDEGLQEWRYRHVMMVRRTIGTKPGTGGSDGADYLTSTLFRPAFPDLWAIRTRF